VRTPRSHYEAAFERYLQQSGVPYAVAEAIPLMARRNTGLKSFDYLIRPPAMRPCLVDLKGRKSTGGDPAAVRQKNWVTRSDVDGLLAWQQVFGPDYEAVFVFAYWLAALGDTPDGMQNAGLTFGGRRYSFWLVSVEEYCRHQRQLSPRWRTVSVPRADFRRISRPIDEYWRLSPVD